MPKQRKKEEIQCQFYRWLVGPHKLSGTYYADGRSNTPSLGRHSLGTKDRRTARANLNELDRLIAVEHGLTNPSQFETEETQILCLDNGRKLYEVHIKRPMIANGPRESTAKRYRAVLDKFFAFAKLHGIRNWNQVNRNVFDLYVTWLESRAYAYATQVLELTTLKQILKYLVAEGHLPPTTLFPYQMRKPSGTDTYCWKPEEVEAILQHCDRPDLLWIKGVLLTLSRTGMRISEAANLRWTDVDFDRNMITLRDERFLDTKLKRKRRTLKSGYDRSIPIHPELSEYLKQIDRHPDGFVFHGPRSGRLKKDLVRNCLIRDVIRPLEKHFPTASDQNGFCHGRLHSFRHYFCSECANTGIPERVLMRWLGHRSSKMVHHYYHLHDEESHRQMARLGDTGSIRDDQVSEH